MKRTYDSDPAWSRGTGAGSNAKKKRQMVSRANLKFLRSLVKKKREADKGKRKTVCVTRTVEMPSAHTIGVEESKLLFMLALGLSPNTEAREQLPIVQLERLDPAVEAEAKARTREVIYEIFQKRKAESLQLRAAHSYSCSAVQAPFPDNREVVVVDLVSDEESNSYPTKSGDLVDRKIRRSGISGNYDRMSRSQPLSDHRSRSQRSSVNSTNSSAPVYRIITSKPRQQVVFKQLINNQESGIFRNWKPETMTKIMNLKKSDNGSCALPLNGSQLLSSAIKAIPVSGSTTLTVRQYREDASSSSVVSNLDYIVPPENLITID